MAVDTSQDKQIDLVQVLLAPLRSAFEMFTAPSHHTTRVHRVEYLRGLSDAQLASRGLRREDIVRHVYHGKDAG